MLNLGDKIIGMFGAMIPEWYGEVVGLEMMPQGVAVDIKWQNGSITEIMEYDLREDYYNPVGSPIGYYLAETRA